jgi:uncharacterized protein YfaS (alpha-2-macroglobulin family)
MMKTLKEWTSHRRSLILIVGTLLAVGVLAAVAAGIVWWRAGRFKDGGETIPILVDTSTPGREGALPSEVDVSLRGDGTVGEDDGLLLIRLSQGQAQPQATEPVPTATGEPLTDEEIEQILARLPTPSVEPQDQVDFRLPEDLLPPPRPGETIEDPFPPPPTPITPKEVAAGPLEVLRFAPEGEIPLAPFVNVTFNQPMVPLATLDALAAEEVPVRLEPALPGTWKWLGTKTLSFEYDSTAIDRLPMATEYVVTVPAGTESATGGVLAETVRWTFSTPPPKMTAHYPSHSPQPLDPLFLVGFDQRIDPEAVLDTVQVTADGQAVQIRPATDAEVEADKAARRVADRAGEGRWLAFVAQEPLPADASIVVTLGPGTPSAEGPLVTKEAQRYDFRTYAPLRIERHGCSWHRDECPPLTPFFIQFNNPIDADAYEESMLRIEPELPGATVNIVGGTITIRGATRGRTTYRVVVDGAIRDTFGQTLGTDTPLTFKVGSAEPTLFGLGETLVTLDPALKKPSLTVYAINYNRLQVRAYQVQPSDWAAFKTYLQEYYRQDEPPLPPPGRKVVDETINLEAAADALTEASIDLSPALEDDRGQLVVVVEPTESSPGQNQYRRVVQAWVQVTQIGLDAFADHSEMVVWTTDLKDGTPLADVTIETNAGQQLAVTDDDGTATFELPYQDTTLLVARQGNDTAILPKTAHPWGSDAWKPRPVQDELRWYVFDDRAMYRPGEEVHIKGWLRQVGGRQNGDVGLVGDALQTVHYRVLGPQGNELLSGQAPVTALGGFDFAITLPTNANLGYTRVMLEAQGNLAGLVGQRFSHGFQVQEFRRPEFEVSARNETTGPYFAGDHAVVAVEASYYAGGPLPNAEVTWRVSSSPSSYSPPNWPDFVFGTWTPWWFAYRPAYQEEVYAPYGSPYEGTEIETFFGMTDASGNHYLRLDFEQTDTSRPFSVLAEATVMDVNRQAWAATTSLLVHPAELYVGLRSERTFVERGKPLDIEIIVTDLDGVAVPDRRVEVRAARMEWKYRQGAWREEAVDVQECIVGSTLEPVSCTFETSVGGKYQITAAVTDVAGRQNQSQFTRWVSGGQRPPARKVELETVTLIPDKESYQPGDMAQILVQSPFSPAEGLLTVGRSGLLYTERFRMDEDTITLQVPIEEKHLPNLNLQVDLVGAAPRTDDQGEVVADVPLRPAYASGQLNLSIPPLQRTLTLQVAPREKELEPGGETTIDVVLTDADGQPVSDAELALVVVNEAILALTNYQLADPVSTFYRTRAADVGHTYGRASVVLASPEALAAGSDTLVVETVVVEKEVEAEAAVRATATPAPATAGDHGPEASPIRVRTDFNPLATFAPAVRTDASGRAQVEVTLPDNLTRYRVMVVAVAGGGHFGSAEANLTARLPLMVRPSAPRFLNFGDRFELPVVLQNQTDDLLTVDVVLRVDNIELAGRPGQRVTVPARDRVEVRFPATTVMPGTARFQIAAVSGAFADATTVELPVYTPATTEAFATYGVVDEGAVAQPVAAPGGVYTQFGGLEISTSSTALQALTDAVLYLVSYPFECSEQLASRILAIAALRDVLTAFSAAGLPSPAEMEATVQGDIERLQGLQNVDGGFPYWRRGHDSVPFHTIHVAHALQRAKLKGFDVPQELQSRALDYLRQIEDHYPSWYGKRTRQTLSAYALYVRDLMGDKDAAKARRLLNEAGLEELSLEAVAWLWQVLNDDPGSAAELEAIRRHINNRAVETAGAANFTTSYGEEAYLLLHSNRRTDAIILDAMIAGDPQSDLIPKVVNGLLAHRTKGRWGNTQENVFVLLALDRYFNTFEAQTPDFVARLWLGETYVGGHTYQGRTTERHETVVPMAYISTLLNTDPATSDETQNLIVSKEGPGRLYYRLGLRYAPTDLDLDPVDMGFVVQRSYEAVDDAEDVVQDEGGVWHIKAGARVRVRLTMVADNRRYHVALVDPLPAGLEIINLSLAVSGDLPQDPNAPDYRYGWWWWGPWYGHQNMRDERAEAFASLLWAGVYRYSYVARATTPGTFVVPPAKAEEMYSPEVFGHSSSARVIVE